MVALAERQGTLTFAIHHPLLTPETLWITMANPSELAKKDQTFELPLMVLSKSTKPRNSGSKLVFQLRI